MRRSGTRLFLSVIFHTSYIHESDGLEQLAHAGMVLLLQVINSGPCRPNGQPTQAVEDVKKILDLLEALAPRYAP